MGEVKHNLRMKTQPYDGQIWQDGVVYPGLWDILLGEDLLLELTTGAPPYNLVIGVPHHAGTGVESIAERIVIKGRNGRAADENCAISGLALLTALREVGLPARLVVAVHATDHDPNKEAGGSYWRSVFSEPLPKLLFELHGAGKTREYCLELSAGRNKLAKPLEFGRRLAHHLNEPHISLAAQMASGHRRGWIFSDGTGYPGLLDNPANSTHLLVHAGQLGIAALHLEMKPDFRSIGDHQAPRPTGKMIRLAQALAKTLYEEMSSRNAAN